MAIRYADDIIKEIELRGQIITSAKCATGEDFEKWLYEEDDTVAIIECKSPVTSTQYRSKNIGNFMEKPLNE